MKKLETFIQKWCHWYSISSCLQWWWGKNKWLIEWDSLQKAMSAHTTLNMNCGSSAVDGLSSDAPFLQWEVDIMETCSSKCNASVGNSAWTFPGKSSWRYCSRWDHLQLAGYGKYGSQSNLLSRLSAGSGICTVDRYPVYVYQSACGSVLYLSGSKT